MREEEKKKKKKKEEVVEEEEGQTPKKTKGRGGENQNKTPGSRLVTARRTQP